MSADPPRSVTFLAWRDPRHQDAGGSELYVHEIARRLAARGTRVMVRAARVPGAPAREILDGVHIVRAGGRLTVYLHGLTHLLSRQARATEVVVDVINGLPFATPLVRRSGLLALTHHVHREQWRMIYPGWPGHLGWFVESVITPRLYRRVPVVTVSAATQADLVELGLDRDQITLVPNGLSSQPSTAPRSLTPRLVVLARLVPHKQVEHALQVVADLRAAGTVVRLDVIGSGWWGPTLRAAAATLGVTELVTFHGQVSAQERDDLLAGAWLMVLPSIKEGWGIAVTEAAAQGTPTVGYLHSGGLQESVVDGHTGWLVGTYTELRATVASVVAEPGLASRRGEAARAWVAGLDWDRSADLFAATAGAVTRRAQ